MGTFIEMPKLSDTMDAGVLVAWKKKEGDPVKAGEVIAEVESDKATMELEAFDKGILRKFIAKVGEPVPVGEAMAIITATADENIDAMLEQAKAGLRAGKKAAAGGAKPADAKPEAKTEAPKAEAKPEAAPAAAPAGTATETATAPKPAAAPASGNGQGNGSSNGHSAPAPGSGGRRVLVSPLAARLAQEFGLDLALISGSGPEGRIIKRDVEQAKASGGALRTAPGAGKSAGTGASAGAASAETAYAPSFKGVSLSATATDADDQEIPNTSMRKAIAQRLTESKQQIPHYYVTIEVCMKQAMALRKQLNALEGVKVSVNDFVIKAAALALIKHPQVNASYRAESVKVYKRIDIATAVAMDEGLITPIVRNAGRKGLMEISQETRELAAKARAKKLKPEEYTGSTFTISNLGMMGVKHFTAVINPPEAAILAVGATQEVPVVEKGQIVIGQRMEVTLSADHRVLDGAQAASFLKDFKYFMENPMTFAL